VQVTTKHPAIYCRQIKETQLEQVPLPKKQYGDSILETVWLKTADFTILDAVKQQIEAGTLRLSVTCEAFLSVKTSESRTLDLSVKNLYIKPITQI
jgi:hypothetical protein